MNDIILYKEKKECCGCMACVAICPQNAIYCIEDEEGFLYPKIDKERCIKCKKCINICSLK